jgi:hypothetical protein
MKPPPRLLSIADIAEARPLSTLGPFSPSIAPPVFEMPAMDVLMLPTDLQRWEREVYTLLKEETHGHAEDFMRAVDGLTGDVNVDRVRTLDVRIDRLAATKSRIG